MPRYNLSPSDRAYLKKLAKKIKKTFETNLSHSQILNLLAGFLGYIDWKQIERINKGPFVVTPGIPEPFKREVLALINSQCTIQLIGNAESFVSHLSFSHLSAFKRPSLEPVVFILIEQKNAPSILTSSHEKGFAITSESRFHRLQKEGVKFIGISDDDLIYDSIEYEGKAMELIHPLGLNHSFTAQEFDDMEQQVVRANESKCTALYGVKLKEFFEDNLISGNFTDITRVINSIYTNHFSDINDSHGLKTAPFAYWDNIFQEGLLSPFCSFLRGFDAELKALNPFYPGIYEAYKIIEKTVFQIDLNKFGLDLMCFLSGMQSTNPTLFSARFIKKLQKSIEQEKEKKRKSDSKEHSEPLDQSQVEDKQAQFTKQANITDNTSEMLPIEGGKYYPKSKRIYPGPEFFEGRRFSLLGAGPFVAGLRLNDLESLIHRLGGELVWNPKKADVIVSCGLFSNASYIDAEHFSDKSFKEQIIDNMSDSSRLH